MRLCRTLARTLVVRVRWLDEDIFMDVDEAVVLDEALCITNLLPKKSARYISRYECFCKDLKLAQAGRCSKRP